MKPSGASEITRWIERLGERDPQALERLVPLLYDELRRLAHRRLGAEKADHTLGTTGLVHEVYLRLCAQRRIRVQDRSDFFAVAATTMRRVLVDYARQRKRQKRGSGVSALSLEEVEPFLAAKEAEEVLDLHDALERLEALQPRVVRVVEHRFFAGLSLEETAHLLGVSKKTIQRDWEAARAWLRKEVGGQPGPRPLPGSPVPRSLGAHGG